MIMKNNIKIVTSTAYLLGVLALTTPLPSWAASEKDLWKEGQAQLEKNLPPGQAADSYRPKLEALGYRVTAINYNKPDYLEYEIVKGDQTWEVQIDVDKATHKATKVDIDRNLWKAEATKEALEGKQVAVAEPSEDSARYSDRNRASTDSLIKELKALPVGHTKSFYRDELKKRGYDITRVNKDDKDELKLEAVKNNQSVQLAVNFDDKTGKSTKVDASSLWVESRSTHEARTGNP
jgi:hypothetical protein